MTTDQKVLKELKKKMYSDLDFSICLNEHLNKYNESNSKEILADYLDKPKVGFKAFLQDYKVGRTLSSKVENKIAVILILFEGLNTKKSASKTADKIQIEGLSSKSSGGNHVTPISMVSKVFMLHRPDIYFPFDSYAKNALKAMKYDVQNTHDSYEKAFVDFQSKSKEEILTIYNAARDTSIDFNKVRKAFEGVKDFDLEKFLIHRITDKLLWVKGKPKPKNKANVV